MGGGRTQQDRPAAHDQPGWIRAVERWLPLALFPLMLLDTAAQAHAKALWFDELISYSLARLPDLGSLWKALLVAADAQPPLTHLLMRLSMAIFGDGELAARLPNLLGFALMSVALYVAIRRRQGALYALCGMLFAWVTLGYEYAYEARPYGLMLGFGACAYLFWQISAEERRPAWAVPGLAASLMLAVSSHYYAGLLVAPLAAGELARSRLQRRLDWPIWAAFAAGGATLAAYAPFLMAIRNNFQGGFWRGVGWDDIIVYYLNLLETAAIPIVATFVVSGIVKSRSKAAPVQKNSGLGGLPKHESAAALCLAALPVAYVALSIYTTGGFTSRYALVSLVGVAVVFVMVLHDALQGSRGAAAAAALTLAAAFLAVRVLDTVEIYSREATPVQALRDVELPRIEQAIQADEQALAVASPLKYAQYAHYGSAGLKARMVYPIDIAAARAYTSGDNCDVTLRSLAPWTGLNTPPVEDFRREHQQFYVATWAPAPFDWLPKALRAEGAELGTVAEWDDIGVSECCKTAAPLLSKSQSADDLD